MIRPLGPPRRKLSFTEEELGELAQEFAEYAAQDIADLLGLNESEPARFEIALEVAHAICSTIDELPHDRPSLDLSLRRAAQETLGTATVLPLLRQRSSA